MKAPRSITLGGTLALALSLTGCGSERSTSPTPVSATPAATPAPGPTPDTRPADSFAFASTNVGDTFQVYVAVPDQYAAEPAAHYPVVYLLDANWNFTAVRGVVGTLARQGDMEPVILV